MNQRQKNKFHRAIKSLSDLIDELNSGNESWELIYNFADCKFNLSKLDMTDVTYKRVVQDDTYMPCVDMED